MLRGAGAAASVNVDCNQAKCNLRLITNAPIMRAPVAAEGDGRPDAHWHARETAQAEQTEKQ
eukprot:9181701-Alexandrium_andersonii.AAC.1